LDNLVIKAISGDQNAERELFQALRVRFEYLAKKRLMKKEDAEDIAQEACLTVLEKYKKADFHGQFTAWAMMVLRNKIGNYLQSRSVKAGKKSGVFDEGISADPGSKPVDFDLINAVVECLSKLIASFPRYARALNLAHQGFETGDICQKMGIKPNNLYVILNRGRRFMKECLGKES